MEEILERFAADCRNRGLADITVSFYVAYARQYLAFLDGKPIPEADRMDVRGHVEELRKRGNTMKSIRYHLAALSSHYDCLIFEGLAESETAAAHPSSKLRGITSKIIRLELTW